MQVLSGHALRSSLACRTQHLLLCPHHTSLMHMNVCGSVCSTQLERRDVAVLLAEPLPTSRMPAAKHTLKPDEPFWKQFVDTVRKALLLGGALCVAVRCCALYQGPLPPPSSLQPARQSCVCSHAGASHRLARSKSENRAWKIEEYQLPARSTVCTCARYRSTCQH